MSRDTVDLDDVLGEEREELAERRKQAGFLNPRGPAGDKQYRPADIDDPVGVAVSGGGVRSAAFSLGVLQSFYERGLLRYCDYLSTVSGGSYVGGFLTSLAVHGHSELRWTGRNPPAASPRLTGQPAAPLAVESNGSPAAATAAAPVAAIAAPSSQQPLSPQPSSESVAAVRRRTDALAERITIEPDAQRRQPHYVRRLVLGSSYLDRPLLFFSHWLPGFLQNNIIAIGGLLFICALGAWLFRVLDNNNSMRLLHALGFSDDISRAFFPTVVVFTIWVLVLGYRALRAFINNRTGASSVAPSLTLLLIVTALISAVSLIGVGDVDTRLLLQRLNIHLHPDVVAQFQTVAHWLLYTVLAVAIIPYLSAEALVRSGAAGASWRDRLFFKFMTHAMLWGVPLVLFGLLASENISQFNSLRDDQFLLSNQTIKNWPAFLATLENSSQPSALTSDGQQEIDDSNQNLWVRLQKKQFSSDLKDLSQLDLFLAAAAAVQELADESTGTSAAEMVRRVAAENEHRTEVARHTSWPRRLGSATLWLFGSRDDNEFEQLLDHEWKFQHDRDLAVALINDQLLRTDFSRIFKPLAEWLTPGMDGKKREPPAGFRGDPAQFLQAYRNAQDIETQLSAANLQDVARHIDRFRQLRLLEAVIEYQLAVHPDRSSWSADLYPLRDRLQSELQALQHPVEKMPGQSEVVEASMETKLRSLEEAHFQLMHAFYGSGQMNSQNDVFARVVVDADQRFRRGLFLGALGVFLLAGLCIDLNSTSLHRFYRDRLASVWLVGAHDKVPLLTQLKTSEKGAPYLLVNCALSFLRSDNQDREATASFLFSYRACGSSRLGFAPSSRYEGGKFDLADAMAISGGAITPTATRNLAVQALMWLMNWRLGRWMSNPSVRALLDRPMSYRRIWQRPQALHLLLSWLLVPEQDRDFHFVSDGGLHENLGIEPLIERRCRLIFAIDAGADPKEQFEDLVKLLLRLRMHHGVEIEALNENSPLEQRTATAIMARSPLGRLLARDEQGRPTPDGTCRSHFVLAKIKYPDQQETGWLVYLRPGFDGDESEALRRFRTQNAHFPNDSTDDQFYTFARFEAYRLLGEHIGSSLCAQLAPSLAEMSTIDQLIKTVERHAASTAVNATSTAATAASLPPTVSRASESSPDAWHVLAVDNLGPRSDELFSSAVIAGNEQPAVKNAKPDGDPPADAKSGDPAAGNGAAGNGAATSTIPALVTELPGERGKGPDAVVAEINVIVDEVLAGKQEVPREALARLESKFDELARLDPVAAIRQSRQIYQRLFQLLGDGAREPRQDKKGSRGRR